MKTIGIVRIMAHPCLLLMLAVGCSADPARPRVQGKVSCKGQAVAGGTLGLYSEGGGGAFFSQKIALRADGTFAGDVPAPGTYKVAIEESLAAQEGAKRAGPRLAVPAKYCDPATSGLVWALHAGSNNRDFDLEE
jgi:hypothetical protein